MVHDGHEAPSLHPLPNRLIYSTNIKIIFDNEADTCKKEIK